MIHAIIYKLLITSYKLVVATSNRNWQQRTSNYWMHLELCEKLVSKQFLTQVITTLDNHRQQLPVGQMSVRWRLADTSHFLLPWLLHCSSWWVLWVSLHDQSLFMQTCEHWFPCLSRTPHKTKCTCSIFQSFHQTAQWINFLGFQDLNTVLSNKMANVCGCCLADW